MDTPEDKKQRISERFPFREDIIIDGTRLCTCMDISESGLYISSIQFFEKNSIIDVIIPFKGNKLTIKAQIQYCQPGIGMGIQFINMDDEQRAAIKELIESIKSSA